MWILLVDFSGLYSYSKIISEFVFIYERTTTINKSDQLRDMQLSEGIPSYTL